MRNLTRDIRYAWRGLTGSPLFTLVALISLSLGMAEEHDCLLRAGVDGGNDGEHQNERANDALTCAHNLSPVSPPAPATPGCQKSVAYESNARLSSRAVFAPRSGLPPEARSGHVRRRAVELIENF
jgi:hypothetical protein